jgi:hypothetical protein
MIGNSRWAVQLIRHVDETRWWHRHILRRRTRPIVVASQVPVGFDFTRSLNRPDSHLRVTIEGADALEFLDMMRAS